MFNIVELNSSNELEQDILSSINSNDNNLRISFDNDYNKSIDSFFSSAKNKLIKKYYFTSMNSNDYSYQIDLLESPIENNLNIYVWFVNCIQIANDIINSKSNKYIELFGLSDINNFKISICKNIMFNYPFTLDDIIFFPIDYIIGEYNKDKSKNIIKTIIHEKIHLAQRYNENVWEQFIIKNNDGWEKLTPNTTIFNLINSNIANNNNLLKEEEIFISNPDTSYDNFKYILINNKNNEKYYGHFVYNKKTKKIDKKYFQINIKKNTLIPISNIDINIDEEHPYEIYAYKISDELIEIFFNSN
jgi:hypothetical protein